MSYYMGFMEANFAIAPNKQEQALQAIKNLAGKETIKDCNGHHHFSWVDTEDFLRAKTVQEALDVWRWETEIDDHDNVTISNFAGEKLGDDEILFQAIAPYVEKDSYIQMQGGDSSVWRWVFDGESMREVHGKLVWE